MQNIAGNKMLAHVGRIVGEHKPITADIFLNNFCNPTVHTDGGNLTPAQEP